MKCFACLFVFVFVAVECRSEQAPAHPAGPSAIVRDSHHPPRIFCDKGKIRAFTWSLSSLLFTNAAIKPDEQLTLVLETSSNTIKVPLQWAGRRAKDSYIVDRMYSNILLPPEGEGVIEVVKSDGNFAAYCGVGLHYALLPHY
jgi:hypothetical protein